MCTLCTVCAVCSVRRRWARHSTAACDLDGHSDGPPPLQDTWTDADGRLIVDAQQDCHGFSYVQRDDVVKFTFTRRFDTCDPQDYIIEVSLNCCCQKHSR